MEEQGEEEQEEEEMLQTSIHPSYTKKYFAQKYAKRKTPFLPH
jgi:hypothetical protein